MYIIKKYFNKLKVTFGYGFTFITKEEAGEVLNVRLNNIKNELFKNLPWLEEEPKEVQYILTEMAYQLGVEGLLGFKNTLKLIKEHKYKEASFEGLNSKWAKEDTPERAKELMNILRNV